MNARTLPCLSASNGVTCGSIAFLLTHHLGADVIGSAPVLLTSIAWLPRTPSSNRRLDGRSFDLSRHSKYSSSLTDFPYTFLQGFGKLTRCRIARLSPDPELAKGRRIARPEGIDGIDRIEAIDLARSFADEVGAIFEMDFATFRTGQDQIRRREF